MIAENHGYELLAAIVHRGGRVHVFVLAKLTVCIPGIVAVLKSNSARLLFGEFMQIRLRLWGGYLWSEGYCVRAVGVVASAKIEDTSTVPNWRCSLRKGRVVHFLEPMRNVQLPRVQSALH